MLMFTNIFVVGFLLVILRFYNTNQNIDKILFQPQALTFLFTRYGFKIYSIDVAWYCVVVCLVSTSILSLVLKGTKMCKVMSESPTKDNMIIFYGIGFIFYYLPTMLMTIFGGAIFSRMMGYSSQSFPIIFLFHFCHYWFIFRHGYWSGVLLIFISSGHGSGGYTHKPMENDPGQIPRYILIVGFACFLTMCIDEELVESTSRKILLEEKDKNFQAMLFHFPEGVAFYDPNHTKLYSNPYWDKVGSNIGMFARSMSISSIGMLMNDKTSKSISLVERLVDKDNNNSTLSTVIKKLSDEHFKKNK